MPGQAMKCPRVSLRRPKCNVAANRVQFPPAMASRFILLVLLMGVLSIGGCKQKTADAADAPKHGTPREAFLTLLRAMRDADAKKITAACQVTDDQRSIIEAGAEYTRAVYAFRDDLINAKARRMVCVAADGHRHGVDDAGPARRRSGVRFEGYP